MGTSELDIQGKNIPAASEFSQPRDPLTPLFNPNVRIQLERFGADSEIINRLYDAEGRFIYTTPDDLDFGSMTVEGVSHTLQERTKPVYDAVDKRLQEDKPENGFNKHNLENHVIRVATMADDLVRMGRGSQKVRILTALAAYGHDVGNINSRRQHALDSTVLYPHILPSLTRNEHDMSIVLEAIRCHDERVLSEELSRFATSEEKMLYLLGKGEDFGEELPMIIAALVLADKADIDRGRVNEAAINMDAVSTDPHVWTNLCAKNEGFSYDRDSQELILRVAFDPRLDGDELERFGPVSRKRSNHEGSRVNYPNDIHKIYKDGLPVFYQWAAALKRIYEERFALMAEMTQIALPARRFKLELVDMLTVADRSEGREDVHIEAEVISQAFEPKDLDALLENNATKFAPKETRLERFSGVYAASK